MSKKTKSKKEPKPKEPSRAEQILELLVEKAMTQKDIAEHFGVEGPAMNSLLHKLIDLGKVKREKTEGSPYFYSLAKD